MTSHPIKEWYGRAQLQELKPICLFSGTPGWWRDDVWRGRATPHDDAHLDIAHPRGRGSGGPQGRRPGSGKI